MRLSLTTGGLCVLLVAALVGGLTPPSAPISAASGIRPRETGPVLVPGVARTTIKIGLHAPLTGASPVPSDSVEKGKDLFFRWVKSRGVTIRGRSVEVILRNDQFNPSTAVAVCKEMVEKEHVFMLFGFQGPDQMQACARYAASRNVPYVSPGSTTLALEDLPNFFGTSKTYAGEGRLLADFFIEQLRARPRDNGVVYYDSPNWRQGRDAFTRAMERRNADIAYDRAVSRTAGTSEARIVIEEMKLAGIDNVFIATTPVWFIQVLKEADNQKFFPTWTGTTVTPANDMVVEVSCSGGDSIDGAKFLSPYPALGGSDRFDDRFRKAVANFYPETAPDDFMWQLWALERVVAKMLDRAGRELTRDRFINRVERSERIYTGVGPTLRYTPDDHFGARDTHLLRASCTDNRWHTARSFVRNF